MNTGTSTDLSIWSLLLIAVVLFFLVYSAILIFHWFAFSMNKRIAIMATILYGVISATFLFSITGAVGVLNTL